ncbi:putative S-adenosylmethionine-dependent methyltransferase CRG1 [Cytospora mali]|uniref:S-adenosylmethionine-dependent methyltransferase CRG1 n=1 Tax=Cytospora mali TaxID=578113 RepID=A0A194V3U4_CYTMA|nr:putative S-adenosylmethionine-dependent methyltransferase CRG1 [Valsa mali var. pyri (nom. inval.)]
MATTTSTTAPLREVGFSARRGANWSEYIVYRPIYRESYFNRIFDYHSQKPQAAWSTAHDVGAGCGIVSSGLAPRFDKIIVSDPNDGYAEIARKLLVEQSQLPETKFRFLQEPAEKSSVETGTVDLIIAAECIQWTDLDVAIQEFNRQLKTGGTLAVTYYTRPRIVGNEQAQKIWDALWKAWCERASSELVDHALAIINTGLESVALPQDSWKGVERIYINTHGSLEPFRLNHLSTDSRVGTGERRVWEEGDEDWYDEQGIDWLKAYYATWVPLVPESETQDLWKELTRALNGAKAKIETPIVFILATKSA